MSGPRNALIANGAGDALAAVAAARRLDRRLARESNNRFRSLRHLITMPHYTPTLRVPVLADAYDTAQQARGDPRRACR